MLNNQLCTVSLQSADIVSLIKSLSASNIYHNNLDDSEFSYPNEKKEIIENHKILQYHLKTHLYSVNLCPCPPETSDTALSSDDDLDGGILSITKRLKEIKEEINLINGTAFEKNSLTDAQHYQLLDVEMFIGDFIAPYAYREVIK